MGDLRIQTTLDPDDQLWRLWNFQNYGTIVTIVKRILVVHWTSGSFETEDDHHFGAGDVLCLYLSHTFHHIPTLSIPPKIEVSENQPDSPVTLIGSLAPPSLVALSSHISHISHAILWGFKKKGKPQPSAKTSIGQFGSPKKGIGKVIYLATLAKVSVENSTFHGIK